MKAEVLPFPSRRNSPTIDQVGVEERAKRFCARSIKKESKMSALKLAVTTLEGADSVGKVQQMCAKAMRPLPEDPSVGPTPFLPHPIRSKGAFKALPPKAIS